ncbi:MAG: reverse transcriptase domain-containing protein [Nanoarchaeota archaeon]
MKSYNNLYQDIISEENLYLAYKKARKNKTTKPYVIEFEKNLKENLEQLRLELLFHSYKPMPLETFILRDPKTRKISKSDFRDRIVHHALVNIIEPIFDKGFIYDSYANRKFKGSLKALERYDVFKKEISKQNNIKFYVLKADVKHYFETVDHEILIKIIKKKIRDKKVIWLIKQIINNFDSKAKGIGMPLGNLTSQFFANVYLNELDKFIKHKLKARYYIRYVDDFIVLHNNKVILEDYKNQIDEFLGIIKLELHPDKSKVVYCDGGASIVLLAC